MRISISKAQIYLFQNHRFTYTISASQTLLSVALCSLWGDGSKILRWVFKKKISLKNNTTSMQSYVHVKRTVYKRRFRQKRIHFGSFSIQ